MPRFDNDLNDLLPAADPGYTNLHFQADDPDTIPDGGVRHISFAAPDADAGVKGMIAFPDPLDGDLVLRGDKTWGAAAAGGASDFLGLSDTPDAYAGAAGKVVAVKGDASGLEFIAAAAGSGASSLAALTWAAFLAETTNGTVRGANAYTLVLFTDSIYSHAVWTGAAWIYFCSGVKVAPPPALANWTIGNAGGTWAAADSAGSITLTEAVRTGNNFRPILLAPGSADFSVVGAFFVAHGLQNYNQCGVCVRDSVSGNLSTFGIFSGGSQVQVCAAASYSGATGNKVALTLVNLPAVGGLVFYRITHQGGNLVYSLSLDGGSLWMQVYSAARSTILANAPNQVGFGIDVNNASWAVAARLVHWKVTNL